MNASPMSVSWTLDTANMSDSFTIVGNISNLPAARINPFIEPYLKARATGEITDLSFNFRGNNAGLNGTLNMKHKALKVALLKETGEKNKILSGLVNLVVRSNSGEYPASVSVDNVQRDNTKSFFNLFWKGIEEGLKKTLIGVNVEKTEKAVKNTVGVTKESVKQIGEDFKGTKDLLQKKEKPEEEEPKKNIFQKIFNKKEKSETP